MTATPRLIHAIIAEQDALLDKLGVAAHARERLLMRASRRQTSTLRRFGILLPIAAAVALWFLVRGAHAPGLTYTSGPSHAAAEVGAWLAAPSDAALPLYFSDRSEAVLSAATHARVDELSGHEARLLLERGRITLTVVHHEQRRWHLRAGPFDVAVTGTRFEVDWNPQRELLEVHTYEGRVEVSGHPLAARAVSAGETLRIARIDGQYRFVETNVAASSSPLPSAALAPPRSATSVELASSVPPPIANNLASPAASTQGEPSYGTLASGSGTSAVGSESTSKWPRTSRPEVTATSWRGLAKSGQYAAALAQAESEGFEALCRNSNASDLLALSEVARLAGSAARARLALESIRVRFQGESAAAVAAYTLGRMAFDGSKDYAGAARWFQTYLKEQAQGSLAREAAGRLIEAHQRAGNIAAAQRAARQYLEQYPNGPQKGLAQRVLSE